MSGSGHDEENQQKHYTEFKKPSLNQFPEKDQGKIVLTKTGWGGGGDMEKGKKF